VTALAKNVGKTLTLFSKLPTKHNNIWQLHPPFSPLAVEEVPKLRARHRGERILEQAIKGVLGEDLGLHFVIEVKQRRHQRN